MPGTDCALLTMKQPTFSGLAAAIPSTLLARNPACMRERLSVPSWINVLCMPAIPSKPTERIVRETDLRPGRRHVDSASYKAPVQLQAVAVPVLAPGSQLRTRPPAATATLRQLMPPAGRHAAALGACKLMFMAWPNGLVQPEALKAMLSTSAVTVTCDW